MQRKNKRKKKINEEEKRKRKDQAALKMSKLAYNKQTILEKLSSI